MRRGEGDRKRQIMPTIQRYVANDFYLTIAKVRRMIYIKAKPPLLEERKFERNYEVKQTETFQNMT